MVVKLGGQLCGRSHLRLALPLVLPATLFERLAPLAHVPDLASDPLLELQPFVDVGPHGVPLGIERGVLLADLRPLTADLSLRPLCAIG